MLGRSVELANLTERLDQIVDHGSALVISGEPGIGKSSLLGAVADFAIARDFPVLETTGVESESSFPYASLHELLRPVLQAVPQLPATQQHALLTAFGVEDGPPPEPFLAALAALNLLVYVATTKPVVVLVDDVHWLDQPSQDVITFVARRIDHDPILIVGSVRSRTATPFLAGGFDEIELHGLGDTAARELLNEVAPELSVFERERIMREAMGNPLALVELPATRFENQAATDSARLTARLERSFGSSVAELSPVARDLLLIAAVSSSDNLSEILAATSLIAGKDVANDVLHEPAERHVLVLEGSHVYFRHPLVRSGVLQSEPLTRQQAAHAALSAVISTDSYRRTWHRAQAIVGPDDEVADELAASHAVALQRGSTIMAIFALEKSAELTSQPPLRGRRLLLAAELAFGLGRADLVRSLLIAASETPLSPLDVIRMEWLREIFTDGVPGDTTRVLQLSAYGLEANQAGELDLAFDLLLAAALRCWWADAGPIAVREVVNATLELSNVPEDDPRYLAVLAVADPIGQARTVMDALSRVTLETVTDADGLRLLGMAAHAVGDQARASNLLDRAEMMLRGQGRLGLLLHALGMHGPVSLDLGDWDRASTFAEEASRFAAETGQPIWGAGQQVTVARAAGLRGETERALELLAAAENSVLSLNDLLAYIQVSRGSALCSAGRFEEAFEALRRLFDQTDTAYHPRESFGGVMFLAEAAVQSNQVDAARRILEDVERVGALTPSPVLHKQLMYARAVLADDSEAEAFFLAGLDADLTQWPWVRARIELAYGSWLRRHRRVSESRTPLRNALTTFNTIGAPTYSDRARVELRAAGERAPAPTLAVRELLSAQELEIARLAAEGLSNREIGQQLYLSPRTVGSHLYRIFPKLDITSRGQLVGRLSQF